LTICVETFRSEKEISGRRIKIMIYEIERIQFLLEIYSVIHDGEFKTLHVQKDTIEEFRWHGRVPIKKYNLK